MRKYRYLEFSFPLLFLLAMTFFPLNSPAHHTSSIAYVLQEIGKKKIGDVEIELNATPPRLIKKNTPKSIQHAHRLLSKFTHRFEVRAFKTKTGNSPLFAMPPNVSESGFHRRTHPVACFIINPITRTTPKP